MHFVRLISRSHFFDQSHAVVHILCPPSHRFDIIRKGQRQCFEDILEVVTEKVKHEWAYYGALRKTTVHRNGPRVFSNSVYSRHPPRKACYNLPHDDINKTEWLYFHHLWLTESKALPKSRQMTSTVWPSSIMRVTAYSKISRLERQETTLIRWDRPCFTKRREMGHFQDAFKAFT